MDAVGEFTCTSLWEFSKDRIKKIKSNRLPNSLGILYSTITQYCGFKVDSGEYKLMGLAPYGQPKYLDQIKEIAAGNSLFNLELDLDFFDFIYGEKMYSNRIKDLFRLDPRTPEGDLNTNYCDLAASVQEFTNIIVDQTIEQIKDSHNIKNLCLSGGVSLNCVTNGILRRNHKDINFSIFPHPGDGGSSIGAAVYARNQAKENATLKLNFDNGKSSAICLGFAYKNSEIEDELKKNNIIYEHLSSDKMIGKIAKLLIEDKIIGIHKDRSEFGPRALGNRSIIALAQGNANQKRVNLKIKYRESFRPFAPIMLHKTANKYFDLPQDVHSPYMQYVEILNEAHRYKTIPKTGINIIEQVNQNRSLYSSITHVDYSARIQTIEEESFVGKLLLQMEILGHDMLINTSFNRRGEPIVETPIDALGCFASTDIDVLVLGDYLIEKTNQSEKAIKELSNTIDGND